MLNLTLVKRIELAMAADTSGPMAADYIPPCPLADESNCRPGDLMDSGKSAKYKAVENILINHGIDCVETGAES